MKKYIHEHTLGMKNQCFLILFLRKAYGGHSNKTRSYSQFKINNRLHRGIAWEKERRNLRQERGQREVEEKGVKETANKIADTNNKFPSITKAKWGKAK